MIQGAPNVIPSASRLSAIEACRILAGEVFRRERVVGGLRAGGLNTERAVRQRLHSVAMELLRISDLDEQIALRLTAIGWLDEDPLTILEKTEALVGRVWRETLPTAGSLLRIRSRAISLIMRLLILQCIAGRVGRWAVRAGEIPDARIARARYRPHAAPEWSQYCALIEKANRAFDLGDYRGCAEMTFDADRLVRTSASLLRASVALTRSEDYIGALWTVRTCLLETEESFEHPAAVERARNLEGRLRQVVEGRIRVPLDAEERRLLGPATGELVEAQLVDDDDLEEIDVDQADIIDEEQHVLIARSIKDQELSETAPLKQAKISWDERYVERAPQADNTRPGTKRMQRLVDAEKLRVDEAAFFLQTLPPRLSPTELEKAQALAEPPPAEEEDPLELRQAVLRLVSETFDVEFPAPESAGEEEETYVPVGPSEEVAMDNPLDDFEEEETQVPPEHALRQRAGVEPGRLSDLDELTDVALSQGPITERIRRTKIRASSASDVLGSATLQMGKNTRETALAALEEEEGALERLEAIRLEHENAKASTSRILLKRVYEVTQVVRVRKQDLPLPEVEVVDVEVDLDVETETEILSSRSPLLH